MPHKHLTQANALHDRPFEKAMLRHRLVHDIIGCIGRAGLTMMIWPRYVAPFRWHLTRYDMPLAGLGREFDGYRVLFLSDFHVGKTRQSYLRRVVAGAMETKPDLILVGGDLIDYWPTSLPKLPEILQMLQAPDGVFAVLGNHDYHEYSWRHIGERSANRTIHRRLRRMLARSQVRVLYNEHALIRRGAAALQIVGVDEIWADQAHPGQAFAKARPDVPTICMVHNPDGYELVKDHPWQWLLCGHSHGGQVDIPMLGALYVPMKHREWLRGFHRFPAPGGGERTMFVSTGIGYSQPLRMRVRPEATLFTLRAS